MRCATVGALLGSPYGTTVYIGHVAYKKMGATRGYSVVNGAMWLVLGFSGMHALVDALVPHEIVSGVLVVIGFSMASQTVASAPPRWYPAVLLGMAICFSDFMVASGVQDAYAFRTLGNGYVFISFLYTFLLMMLIDRWFLHAMAILIVLLLCASCGLIHAERLSLRYTRTGTLAGNEAMAAALGEGMPGWKLIGMYGAAAALMLGFHAAQKRGYIEAPEASDFRQIQRKEATVQSFGQHGGVELEAGDDGDVACLKLERQRMTTSTSTP